MNPMSKLAMAEKMSVQQLQQSIKNGTIESFIGIPLLQEKMKQAQTKAPVQAPQQPPIAQEVMSQASGIDQMPSNLPTQGMADGGIVAFADGGDAEDDDYEEFQDNKEESEHRQSLEDNYEQTDKLAQMMGERKSGKDINRTPDVEGGIRSVAPKGKEFYGAMYNTLKSRAEEMGLPNPEAIARVGAAQSALETGYGKHLAGGNNYFGIKGSGGNRQSTQEYSPERGMHQSNDSFRTYGGLDQSADDYLRLMQNPRYQKVLNATSPEEAIAHQGRSGYATDPRYGSSLRSIHLANMADGGIVGLSKGGVAHFFKGGSSDDPEYSGMYSDNDELKSAPYESPLMTLANRAKERGTSFKSQQPQALQRSLSDMWDMPEGTPPVSTPVAPQRSLADMWEPLPAQTEKPSQQLPASPSWFDESANTGVTPEQRAFNKNIPGSGDYVEKNVVGGGGQFSGAGASGSFKPSSTTAPVSPAERTAYDDFMDYFKQGREDLKKQKQEDKYMSLLQAGLGMMSGTSPNALANIGQGASMGVAHYGAAAKQRAAEENALMKGAIGAQRYKEMGEDRRSAQDYRNKALGITTEANAQRARDTLDEKEMKRLSDTEKFLGNQIQTIKANTEAAVKAEFTANPMLKMDENLGAKINAEVARRLASNPDLKRLHSSMGSVSKQIYGEDYTMPSYLESPAAGGGNRIRVDSSGNIIK